MSNGQYELQAAQCDVGMDSVTSMKKKNILAVISLPLSISLALEFSLTARITPFTNIVTRRSEEKN